jgi:hypothetical protein
LPLEMIGPGLLARMKQRRHAAGLGGGRLLGTPRTCCSLWVKVQSAFAQETVMPSQKRANEAARRLAGSDPVFGFQTENGTCLRVRPV